MEPEVVHFLKLIAKSIGWLVLWMLVNSYFGIKMGLLFAEQGFSFWNVLYYILMIASFVWLVRHIILLWKGSPVPGNE